MTPTETTIILRQFNEWQRGRNTVLRPSSNELGEAIDAAVEMIDRLEAAEKERDDVAQQLVQSEIGKRKAVVERDVLRDRLALESQESGALHEAVGRACEERDELRAKIAEMEQQEPVAFALYSGGSRRAVYLSEIEACEQRDRRQLTADLGGSLEAYRVVPLYALPGAKGEQK